MRMLAYGTSANAVDEYLKIAASTTRDCLQHFVEGVISKFGQEYLRRATPSDVELLLRESNVRGFPDLWIWHAFFGTPGSLNDINVLQWPPMFDDICEGRAPEVSFNVNGNRYNMGYYLTDGIYPTAFIPAIKLPQTSKQRLFTRKQESYRKDVERAFGVLQARFAIIRQPV
ncbi:uncharacterized protein LOC110703711 [Chenopodium quinoa]|uniref:uncharacterized protein LOC110703711 n=1 Tax=Chenopodium quinoa TaxID=63459 RepID=UPI000B79420B|nr:uncharacterized protein LOC110703711 [Chenopodium quinoa]